MDAITDTRVTVVRASSLSGYPDCPRRGATKLLRQEIEAAGYMLRSLGGGIGAATGSGVHAGAALALTEKASSGQLAPFGVATDAAVETLRQRVRDDGATFDRETPDLRAAESQVLAMTRAYYFGVAPKVQPVLVESRLEADVGFTVQPMILTGQQDVLAREPGRIRDLKTGKNRSNHKPQLGSYALLAKSHPEVLGGVTVLGAVEDFVQRVSAKKVAAGEQPPAISFMHNLDGAERAAVAVLRMIDAHLTVFRRGDPSRYVEAGDPWAFPANPSSKLCSEKWCPAWGTSFCAEHQSTETE